MLYFNLLDLKNQFLSTIKMLVFKSSKLKFHHFNLMQFQFLILIIQYYFFYDISYNIHFLLF